MREEIATKNDLLSEALNRSAARGREAQELRSRLSTWAEDIAHLLGPESAFNEQVMRREVRDIRAFGGALQMLPPVRLMAAGPRGSEEAPQFVRTENVIEAAIYLARIDGPEADKMRRQLRIVLESRNGSVAYAMGDDRHRHWSPRDVDYMARMIALAMAKHLAVERG
jgi:hypothetical protein